jgi:hypothetical protein
MPGPATKNFKRAIAGSGVHLGAAVQPAPTVQPHMLVERGDETSLYGRDGHIYKGREASSTTFAALDPPFVNQKFTVAYRDKSPGNRPARPQTAHTVGDRVQRLKGSGSEIKRGVQAYSNGGSPNAQSVMNSTRQDGFGI